MFKIHCAALALFALVAVSSTGAADTAAAATKKTDKNLRSIKKVGKDQPNDPESGSIERDLQLEKLQNEKVVRPVKNEKLFRIFDCIKHLEGITKRTDDKLTNYEELRDCSFCLDIVTKATKEAIEGIKGITPGSCMAECNKREIVGTKENIGICINSLGDPDCDDISTETIECGCLHDCSDGENAGDGDTCSAFNPTIAPDVGGGNNCSPGTVCCCEPRSPGGACKHAFPQA